MSDVESLLGVGLTILALFLGLIFVFLKAVMVRVEASSSSVLRAMDSHVVDQKSVLDRMAQSDAHLRELIAHLAERVSHVEGDIRSLPPRDTFMKMASDLRAAEVTLRNIEAVFLNNRSRARAREQP